MRIAPRPWILQGSEGPAKRYQTRAAALSGLRALRRRGGDGTVRREDALAWYGGDVVRILVEYLDGARWRNHSLCPSVEAAEACVERLAESNVKARIAPKESPEERAAREAAFLRPPPAFPPMPKAAYLEAGWYLFDGKRMVSGPYASEEAALDRAREIRIARMNAHNVLPKRLSWKTAISVKQQ